jgi:bifunctional oligoribonuclease and PAP phosphatase NrnA
LIPIDYKIVKDLLSSPKKITILIHHNPDGDAIGASLALYLTLIKQKHDVKLISPNDFPAFYKWMKASSDIVNAYNTHPYAKSCIDKAEIIFCVDFNSIERTNNLMKVFNKSKAVSILIDHHPDPEPFCTYALSDIKTSSASELVYDFIVSAGMKKLIDKNISECLYAGIMTDTGSFSYSCNIPKTYEVTAELMKHGIDAQNIHNLVYDTNSENRMKLLGYSLYSAMKVFPEYGAAYIALSREELKKFNFKIGDTEGFVNYPISMKNIFLSVLFMEMEDQIKISFRSKGDFDVNEFSRKHFEGGGHKNAAGGKSKLTLEKTLNKFEEILLQYKKDLKISRF